MGSVESTLARHATSCRVQIVELTHPAYLLSFSHSLPLFLSPILFLCVYIFTPLSKCAPGLPDLFHARTKTRYFSRAEVAWNSRGYIQNSKFKTDEKTEIERKEETRGRRGKDDLNVYKYIIVNFSNYLNGSYIFSLSHLPFTKPSVFHSNEDLRRSILSYCLEMAIFLNAVN